MPQVNYRVREVFQTAASEFRFTVEGSDGSTVSGVIKASNDGLAVVSPGPESSAEPSAAEPLSSPQSEGEAS